MVDGQALPSLAVDAQGQVTVVWYDTREDPLKQDLDVFGTVSNDGGQTFSPNFRLTDTTFNPAAGAFTDANGTTSDYLGDRIGLVAVNGVAYAVWTDTRNGSQEIYLQKYSLNQPPAPPLDRFYPDNTPATATDLGQVTAQQLVPDLTVGPANDNWFSLQAGASGELDVVATATSGDAGSLQVELTDASGNVLPAVVTPVLDASGAVIGSQLVFASVAGQTYLVHVSGGTATIGYSLVLQSLTADLGTSVEGSQAGTVAAGGQDLYRLEAAVAGSLVLTLTPDDDVSGDLVLNVLERRRPDGPGLGHVGRDPGRGPPDAQPAGQPGPGRPDPGRGQRSRRPGGLHPPVHQLRPVRDARQPRRSSCRPRATPPRSGSPTCRQQLARTSSSPASTPPTRSRSSRATPTGPSRRPSSTPSAPA